MQKIDIVILFIRHPVEDKILAIKRSSADKTYGGMWALPGGSVEETETEHTAAKRELMEETGLNLINMENTPEIVLPLEVEGKTYMVGIYKAKVDKGTLEPHDKDISEADYIDTSLLLKSLRDNKYPEKQIKILERYLSKQLTNLLI